MMAYTFLVERADGALAEVPREEQSLFQRQLTRLRFMQAMDVGWTGLSFKIRIAGQKPRKVLIFSGSEHIVDCSGTDLDIHI